MDPDLFHTEALSSVVFSGFDKFQKVVGSHQGFFIHQPEAGFMQFLDDLGLVAADVSQSKGVKGSVVRIVKGSSSKGVSTLLTVVLK